jgi:Tol biopolymer transport system component
MWTARQAVFLSLIVLVAADDPGPQPVHLWPGDGSVALGRPSPDGRYISSVDTRAGDVILRDLRTGDIRKLTHNGPAERGQFAYFSAISPDSRRIAYAWFNEDGFYELRVIDSDGAGAQTIYRNPEAGFVQPCAWSPDGNQVLTLLFRKDNTSQIALIPSRGGTARVIKSLNWLYPKRMDLSPDGTQIVYDAFVPGAESSRDLYLLAVDGSSEKKLAANASNDLFPVFSSDGKTVFFASDRAGTMDLWAVPTEGGDPHRVQKGLGRFMPLGLTTENRLIYVSRSGGTNIALAALANGREADFRSRYPDRNVTPWWSADGEVLAYLSRRGTENFGTESREVIVHRLSTRQELTVPVKLAHIERVQPSRDGSSLLIAGSDARGRGGLFLTDSKGGTPRPFAVRHGTHPKGFPAAWSADGGGVYWIEDTAVYMRKVVAKERISIATAPCPARCLAVSPDGQTIALACDSQLYTVQLAGGEPALAAELRSGHITSVAWGSATHLAVGVGPSLMELELRTGATRLLGKFEGSQGDYAVHAASGRVAYTKGRERHDLWSVRVP